MNLQAMEHSRIFICMMQKLKPGDSPNSSHRLTHSLNGRGITEAGERKTNLQRRNFPLMTPLIIHFLIRKSSLMRCNRTLNFHENYSCPGIRRVIAHHAQPLPSVQFHLQIMQVPQEPGSPFLAPFTLPGKHGYSSALKNSAQR